MAEERLSPFAEWMASMSETYGDQIMLKWIDECHDHGCDPVDVWVRTMAYLAHNPMDEKTKNELRDYGLKHYGLDDSQLGDNSNG
jgi:hypothetical protein